MIYTNSHDKGTSGVRDLGEYLGKVISTLVTKYRDLNRSKLVRSIESQTTARPFREECVPLVAGSLYVWDASSLAVHHGFFPLAGSVSTRVHKRELTALEDGSISRASSQQR